MKQLYIFTLLALFFLPDAGWSQGKPNYVGEWYHHAAQGKKPHKGDVFKKSDSDYPRTKRYNLKANANQLNSILNTKPELLDLIVPYGDKTYTLNLAKVEITSPGFTVQTDKGNNP